MNCPICGLDSGETSVQCSKHIVVVIVNGKVVYCIDSVVTIPQYGYTA